MRGIILAAEKPCNLKTHLRYTLHVVKIAILTLHVAPRIETVEFLPEVGSLRIFHKSSIRRLSQSEQEFSFTPLGLRQLGGLINNPFRQPCKVFLCQPYFIGVQLLQHILPELRGQFAQLCTEFTVSLTVCTLKIRPRQRKRIICAVEQHLILGRKVQLVAPFINRLHPLP